MRSSSTATVPSAAAVPSTSSSAFDCLKVPAVGIKPKRQILVKLPHDIWGQEAMGVLSAQEEELIANEMSKAQRKKKGRRDKTEKRQTRGMVRKG